MGHKVFVSYKFNDATVARLFPPSTMKRTTVRDYVNIVESKIKSLKGYVYKGEEKDEDLSDKSDDVIWGILKDKMYGSSVTILFISPQMRKAYTKDRDQWIPWEIAYSLRDETRNGRKSHANAIVAVVLPDYSGSYGYCTGMIHFKIVRNNIDNGYIRPVKWDLFINNVTYYIDKAVELRDSFPEDELDKTVD